MVSSGNPLVSAIIPTYNRSRQVCAAIDSILAQTYAPVEIIVVDDGSDDDTEGALRQYGRQIYFIRQANAGPAAARNAGVEASQGAFIAFLDSDDVWLPERLETQVEILAKAGDTVPCCLCDVQLYKYAMARDSAFVRAGLSLRDSAGLWLNPFEVLATRFFFFNQAALIRRSAFDGVNGFDGTLRFLEDYDLALRLALPGPWAFVARALVVWNQGTDSLSREALSKQLFLNNCLLQIQLRISETPAVRGNPTMQKRVRQEMNRTIRLIRIVRMAGARSFWSRFGARLLSMKERLRMGIFRRTPWYPKMQTAPIDPRAAISRGSR